MIGSQCHQCRKRRPGEISQDSRDCLFSRWGSHSMFCHPGWNRPSSHVQQRRQVQHVQQLPQRLPVQQVQQRLLWRHSAPTPQIQQEAHQLHHAHFWQCLPSMKGDCITLGEIGLCVPRGAGGGRLNDQTADLVPVIPTRWPGPCAIAPHATRTAIDRAAIPDTPQENARLEGARGKNMSVGGMRLKERASPD